MGRSKRKQPFTSPEIAYTTINRGAMYAGIELSGELPFLDHYVCSCWSTFTLFIFSHLIRTLIRLICFITYESIGTGWVVYNTH